MGNPSAMIQNSCPLRTLNRNLYAVSTCIVTEGSKLHRNMASEIMETDLYTQIKKTVNRNVHVALEIHSHATATVSLTLA